MKTVVLTTSDSYKRHLQTVLAAEPELHIVESLDDLQQWLRPEPVIILLHAASFPDIKSLIARISSQKRSVHLGVASDIPTVRELLELAGSGINAYFNSYMADLHYAHMLRTVSSGQKWFAPQLQEQLLALAVSGQSESSSLQTLSSRELQIAQAVADGLSNKAIARAHDITERTVKAHLTRIFEKLGVKSRLELAKILLQTHSHS